MEYNRLLMQAEMDKLRYLMYMWGWKIKAGTKRMFPSRKQLNKLYPYTKRYPVLLPFLWMGQIVSFPIRRIASGALKRDVRFGQSELSKVSDARIRMFRGLDML